MGFRVVCISRAMAAAGEDIGEAVAQQLGFRYVDEQIIRRAAQLAQVDPALVAKAEHRQPLLQRLLEKLPRGANVVDMLLVTAATGVPAGGTVTSAAPSKANIEDLRVMIQATIHEVAAAGQAVIVAHAASLALANSQDVLRVLVTASAATRVRRVAESERIVQAEAERRVAESDRERREYLRAFYKVEEELATYYDLVINTDVLTPAQAAAVVVAAANAPA